jgi:regulator of PEP synthase PpsR (kinase-PPPase family)
MAPTDPIPPVYVVSGGAGASGEQIVNSVLAQFPQVRVPLVTVPHVLQRAQIGEVVRKAERTGGTIVHTFVDRRMREEFVRAAEEAGVTAIDLMGDLLQRVEETTGVEPEGRPGLYRKLKRDYFERVAAIDYAMTHDDGMNPEGWKDAELVLVGVSRAGKTPLAMYLAVLGWRAANVPLVPGIPLPKEIDTVDRRRILALDIDPSRLSVHRSHRQRALGVAGPMEYTDEGAIWREVEAARRELKRRGYSRINVTDKPMETLVDDVIRTITRRLGADARR